MDRNLVLLLGSGHTVKIALRPDDLPSGRSHGIQATADLVEGLSAVTVSPFGNPRVPDAGHVMMAYIEDMTPATIDETPNEFQRIDSYSPGEDL